MAGAEARKADISAELAFAWRSVAHAAARQQGVVSRSQLLSAGVPPSTIDDWARSGRLHRVHRGVFAVGVLRTDPDARWAAAVLAAGTGSLLSHRSSAEAQRVLRLDELTFGRSPIHVTRPGHSARRDGLVIHAAAIDPVDTTKVRGIPATSPTRTLFDLCRTFAVAELRRAFEEADYLGVVDHQRLRVLCGSAPGHRGVAELRALVEAERLPIAETRSRLEALLLRACSDHGLPIPAVNVPLLGYVVDFIWESERFVIEVDGSHHRGRRRDRDNRRDLELGLAGHLVRRVSANDLADPAALSEQIATVLRERARPTPRLGDR